MEQTEYVEVAPDENKSLAFAVIDKARKDFISGKSSASTVEECYLFITGKSAMSKFWFDLVELPFLDGALMQLRTRLILVEASAQAKRDQFRVKENRKPRMGERRQSKEVK